MKTLNFFTRTFLPTTALATGIIAGSTTLANAQAMTPMRQLVTSYSDQFAIRVQPKNPYKHRIKMIMRVYDENFNLIRARVAPRQIMMGAGSSRPVTVTVPFEGKKSRKIRICAESTPFPSQKTRIKARVCGRFLAQRAG